MSNETESLSAILASARASLEDDSWIDEITLPDEDGQPNDYARRVVPLDDALAALDRIDAAARRELETADLRAIHAAEMAERELRRLAEDLRRVRRWHSAVTVRVLRRAGRMQRARARIPPAGDIAERLKAELAEAHDAIARLEAELAEARRERDTACAERALPPVPGNAAALREALIYVRDLMRRVKDGDRISSCAFLGVVEHALSAPPRNCDVGTEKEQAVRQASYCIRHSPLPTDNCDNCPLRGYNRASPERLVGYSCALAWGQLPFVAAEGGAEC